MNTHRVLLALCLLSPSLSAQEEATDRLLCDPAALKNCSGDRMEVVFEHSGSSVLHLHWSEGPPEIEISVFIDAANVHIQGWSYGIRHEDAFLQLQRATFEGTDAERLYRGGFQQTSADHVHTCKPPPEAKCAEDEPGGGYVSAVVLALLQVAELPPGRSTVSRATYTLASQSREVSTVISISDQLRRTGSPPVGIFITEAGRSLQPTFVRDGRLVIEPAVFHRGDPDGDGRISILDALQVFLFLFIAGPAPACFEAADFDDDGRIDGSDPILILRWLFLNGTAPASPGAPSSGCGPDPVGSPYLGCGDYPAC
jgi:hypothetical protein